MEIELILEQNSKYIFKNVSYLNPQQQENLIFPKLTYIIVYLRSIHLLWFLIFPPTNFLFQSVLHAISAVETIDHPPCSLIMSSQNSSSRT